MLVKLVKSSLNLNYCCYNYYSNYDCDYDSIIIVNFKVVDYYCYLNAVIAANDSIITFMVISDSSDVGYHFTRIVIIAIVNCGKLIIAAAGVTFIIIIIAIEVSIAVD